MNHRAPLLIATGISSLISIVVPVRAAAPEPKHQITILYDAFGTDPSMSKDWGFSALVEIAGKRILFDTGNDADIFAANVKIPTRNVRRPDGHLACAIMCFETGVENSKSENAASSSTSVQ
jgi:hypothetical protein